MQLGRLNARAAVVVAVGSLALLISACGSAPGPAPSPLPWIAAVAAGGLLTLGGAARLRRVRVAARHAR